jgi:MFS family permease
MPAPHSDPGPGNLFHQRNFLCLWLISIVHNLGEKLFFVFLIMLGDLTSHSNSLVSAISLAFSAPAVLFGSVAGVFVDRFSIRTLMIVSCLLRAALVLAVPFAGTMVGPILAFAFGFSLLTRFFDPAFMKAVPTLVDKEHLMAANSVFMTTMVGALIGSFAIAGPIWTHLTPHHAHWVVVGLYVLGALGAALIRMPPKLEPEARAGDFWKEWRFAFQYLRDHPRLLKAYTMTMTMFGTFAALNVIAKGFALSALRTTNASDFTYILAVVGLGMVGGAGLLGRFGRAVPKPRLVRIGFITAGSAVIALALVGVFARSLGLENAWRLAYALAVFVGAGGACIEIPVSTLIQEGVEPEVRGRIFGVQAMLMNLASTLPMAIAGPLADWWGPAVVMGLLGVQMAVMALFRLSDPAEARPA